MIKSIVVFATGFLTALVLLVVLLWLGRDSVMQLFSFGYQYEKRQVVLLKDVRLYQNGTDIGYLKSGIRLRMDGFDKTSPIENYSIVLGWENRGANRGELFRESADDSVYTELKPEK